MDPRDQGPEGGGGDRKSVGDGNTRAQTLKKGILVAKRKSWQH